MIPGSLEWMERTNGAQRYADRLYQLVQGMSLLMETGTLRWRRRWGLASPSLQRAAWRDLEIPKSPIAQAALALCTHESSPALLNHCLRTYAWGVLLGVRDGLRPDRELFWVASLLHDLGLTESHAGPSDAHCFAVIGARAARDFLLKEGWDATRVAQVTEAIGLHINVAVPLKHGVEAHLLHEGAGFDVVGARFRNIESDAVNRVLALYPRHGLKEELAQVLTRESAVRPLSRMHELCTRYGATERVLASPFAE